MRNCKVVCNSCKLKQPTESWYIFNDFKAITEQANFIELPITFGMAINRLYWTVNYGLGLVISQLRSIKLHGSAEVSTRFPFSPQLIPFQE